MIGSGLPPPSRGQRDVSPLRVGDEARRAAPTDFGPARRAPDRGGGVGGRGPVPRQRPSAEPSGVCQFTDSIETSTDNLPTRSEDIAMTSAVLLAAMSVTGIGYNDAGAY